MAVESAAGTYAELAGIEIVNNTRVMSYLENGLGPASLNIYGDCNGNCGCSNLIELLDCPGVTGYVDPATDIAPWYSADISESADFLGFYADEFTGLDSPFTRDVKQTVNNGGVLSRSRLSTRELTWRGYLFGATCCSVQYGLRWLSKTLSRFNVPCKDCFGDDLEFLFCCPAVSGSIDPFRTLKGVGLTEGPIIVSERATCRSGCSSGCGGSCIIEIEFTLVASQPYFYSTEIPIYNCINLAEGALEGAPAPELDCPPFDCSDPLFTVAGACQLPSLPPIATYSNTCFDSIELLFDRINYISVPRSYWGDLEEVVPVITISNFGPLTSDGVKLSFYTSPDDNPCVE